MVAQPPQVEPSFVVRIWVRAFSLLRRVSLFDVVRRLRPALATSAFSEAWVIAHTLLAFLAMLLAVWLGFTTISVAVVIYGFFRVFEITVYQTNVLLFDPYRAARDGRSYAVAGYLRLVLLLLHNYAEIVFWFAAAYATLDPAYVSLPDRSIIGALYGSFRTMVSLGPAEVTSSSTVGLLVIWWQSLAGLLLTLIALGRFVGMLPPVASSDRLERPTDGE